MPLPFFSRCCYAQALKACGSNPCATRAQEVGAGDTHTRKRQAHPKQRTREPKLNVIPSYDVPYRRLLLCAKNYPPAGS